MKTEKEFKNKRLNVKKQKREMKYMSFESISERKRFKEDLNREYRSLKRSEKQEIDKYIEAEIENE